VALSLPRLDFLGRRWFDWGRAYHIFESQSWHMKGNARFPKEPQSQQTAAIPRRRGKQRDPTKIMVSLRIDRDVVEALRATGKGWHSRINEALRKLMAS